MSKRRVWRFSWTRYLIVEPWCHTVVCSRSLGQRTERICNQRGYTKNAVVTGRTDWSLNFPDLNQNQIEFRTTIWQGTVISGDYFVLYSSSHEQPVEWVQKKKKGIIWPDFDALTVSLAAAFWTLWSLFGGDCGTPMGKASQYTYLKTMKAEMSATVAAAVRYLRIKLLRRSSTYAYCTTSICHLFVMIGCCQE